MFYSEKELETLSFNRIGKNCKISKKTSFYGASRISLGDDVRIDDFCVISAGSGGISLGNNVHIAVQVSIIGAAEIVLEDFCGLSSKVCLYSSNDDYSGDYMTGPTLPKKFTNVLSKKVWLKKHVVVGCGSVILPGVTIGECTAVGSLSLVNTSLDENIIACGVPAKKVKSRSTKLKSIEEKFLLEKNEK